ncbi:MAG: hypothetical protein KGL63_01260 [Betaproteobacteria bacterium]|nr:hypothetical protein [Betaproteobacteria bacterium]
MTLERLGSPKVALYPRRRIPLLDIAPTRPANFLDAVSDADVVVTHAEDAATRGYQDGFAEGIAAAEEEAQRLLEARTCTLEESFQKRYDAAVAELDTTRTRLLKLIHALQQNLEEQHAAAEALAIEIAYTALGRLLGELAEARTLTAAWCRHVAAEFAGTPCRLRLAPVDAPLVAAWGHEVTLLEDAQLAPGSVVLETPRGEVHTSLAQRMDGVQRALLKALAESQELHRARRR